MSTEITHRQDQPQENTTIIEPLRNMEGFIVTVGPKEGVPITQESSIGIITREGVQVAQPSYGPAADPEDYRTAARKTLERAHDMKYRHRKGKW